MLIRVHLSDAQRLQSGAIGYLWCDGCARKATAGDLEWPDGRAVI
jgi:hypothetical protein